MFYYFGRKDRLRMLYPLPRHDTIIEPFAGSAAYALGFLNRDVILVEKDPIVSEIWRWLIDDADPQDLELPDLEPGDTLPAAVLGEPRSALIRLASEVSNKGTLRRRPIIASEFMKFGYDYLRRTGPRTLPLVKHWTIIEGDYTDAPDVEATWFVDPPYQDVSGYGQRNSVDYPALAEWVQTRQGFTIACDHASADWLPFRPLTIQQSVSPGNSNMEGIWTNDDDKLGAVPVQLDLLETVE